MTIFALVLFCGWVYVVGFLMGARFYAKRTKHDDQFIERVVEEVTKGKNPEGDFIRMNPVEDYLKEHEGETINLGDIIE